MWASVTPSEAANFYLDFVSRFLAQSEKVPNAAIRHGDVEFLLVALSAVGDG